MFFMLSIYRWIFWIIFSFSFFAAAGVGTFFYELSKSLPKNIEAELQKRNEILPTVLYDREGNQIEEFHIQRRIPVSYERFPPHLIQACLTANCNHHNTGQQHIQKATVSQVIYQHKQS